MTDARTMGCRSCETPLTTSFVNLGTSPLCQVHVAPDKQSEPESFFTLHAFVCRQCFLVQLGEFVAGLKILLADDGVVTM